MLLKPVLSILTTSSGVIADVECSVPLDPSLVPFRLKKVSISAV